MPAPVMPSKAPKSRSRSRSSVRTRMPSFSVASCAVVSARLNGELSTAVGRSSSGSSASHLPSASACARPVSDSGTSGSRTSSSSRPAPPAGPARRRRCPCSRRAAPARAPAGPAPGRPRATSARPPAAAPPDAGSRTAAAPKPVHAVARQDDRVTAADRPAGARLPRPGGASRRGWRPSTRRRPGVYVKLAKKGAGVPSVTYAELVESCLCFGWIDGRSNRLDDRFYLQRITPRRARSVWSQKNVDAVEALTRRRAGCGPRGLAAVEAARADGRWERAYAGSATITVPDDLAAALAAEPAAQAAFDGARRHQPVRRPLAGAHRGDAGHAGQADRRPGADARRGPPPALSRASAQSALSRGGRRTGSRPGRRW